MIDWGQMCETCEMCGVRSYSSPFSPADAENNLIV
jgi:hypothetical protein